MATKTHIVNLALLRIGVSQRVSDVDTEQTTEALSAKLIFDDERDFVLRDFSWPFARKYATPVLIDGTVDAPANGDWIFAYTYPNDCLFVRRVMNCQGRQATSPPPFVTGRSAMGVRLIFTNQEDAGIEYTVQVTNAAEFDGVFVSMLAWRLAATLALSLSRMPEMAKTCLEAYAAERAEAISRAVAEGEYQVASGQADPRVREIFQLALTRVGISRQLAAVKPELHFAALWPRVNFADERDFVLRDFPWPWATAYAVPELITGSPTSPANGDWIYAYRYPSDALFIRRIVVSRAAMWITPRDECRQQGLAWPPPFRIGSGAVPETPGPNPSYVRGRLIFTNMPIDAASGTSIEYTLQVTDPLEFDAAFVSMLAWRLAATLAPSTAETAKDPKLADRVMQMYEIEKSRAQRMALNEGQSEESQDAEWVRGR